VRIRINSGGLETLQLVPPDLEKLALGARHRFEGLLMPIRLEYAANWPITLTSVLCRQKGEEALARHAYAAVLRQIGFNPSAYPTAVILSLTAPDGVSTLTTSPFL
jgi:hypothetical protein